MLSPERIQELGAIVKKKYPEFGTNKVVPPTGAYGGMFYYMPLKSRTFGDFPAAAVSVWPTLKSSVACCGIRRIDGGTKVPAMNPSGYPREPYQELELLNVQSGTVSQVWGEAEKALFAIWLNDNPATRLYSCIIASTASADKDKWAEYERFLPEAGFVPLTRNVNLQYDKGRGKYCTLWKFEFPDGPNVLGEMPEYKKFVPAPAQAKPLQKVRRIVRIGQGVGARKLLSKVL